MNRLLVPLALALLGALVLAACGAGAPATAPTPTDTPAGAPANTPAPTDAPAATTPPAGTGGPTDAGAPAGGALAGTSWVLTNLNGQPPAADTQITLTLEADGLFGSDGCNRYRGSYTADGDTITVGENLAGTMMACPEPVMQQAAAYQAALKAAATFKIEGEQLTLFDAAGAPLATFAAQSAALAGSSWTVTAYNNGNQAVVGVLAGTTLTLEFTDTTVGGSSGCNSFSGGYEAADGTLTVGTLASTQMLCAEPAGVMEQETQFLQALATAATYRVEGDQLEIRTADDAMVLTATRTPTP